MRLSATSAHDHRSRSRSTPRPCTARGRSPSPRRTPAEPSSTSSEPSTPLTGRASCIFWSRGSCRPAISPRRQSSTPVPFTPIIDSHRLPRTTRARRYSRHCLQRHPRRRQHKKTRPRPHPRNVSATRRNTSTATPTREVARTGGTGQGHQKASRPAGQGRADQCVLRDRDAPTSVSCGTGTQQDDRPAGHGTGAGQFDSSGCRGDFGAIFDAFYGSAVLLPFARPPGDCIYNKSRRAKKKKGDAVY